MYSLNDVIAYQAGKPDNDWCKYFVLGIFLFKYHQILQTDIKTSARQSGKMVDISNFEMKIV